MKRRVKILRDISLLPYATLKKGEQGTVIYSEEDDDGVMFTADVELDLQHAGLAPWGNQAHLVLPELASVAALNGVNRFKSLLNLTHTAIVAAGILGLLVGATAAHWG